MPRATRAIARTTPAKPRRPRTVPRRSSRPIEDVGNRPKTDETPHKVLLDTKSEGHGQEEAAIREQTDSHVDAVEIHSEAEVPLEKGGESPLNSEYSPNRPRKVLSEKRPKCLGSRRIFSPEVILHTSKYSSSRKPLRVGHRSRKSVSASPSTAIPSIGGIGLDLPAGPSVFSSPFTPRQEEAATKAEHSKIRKGRLAGRNCLVTGATSGIGYEIAKRFLQEGAASVFSISRKQGKIALAGRRMEEDLNSRELPFIFLLGDITDTDFLHEKIVDNMRLANIDVLVNAAGISQSSPLRLTSTETSQHIMATNLNATIALCKVFNRLARRRYLNTSGKVRANPSGELDPALEEANNQNSARRSLGSQSPGMETRGSPCIINVSSLLGLKGGLGATSYAASKAGVLGFTRALVCEYGRSAISTRVNAIVPGYIDTPMTRALFRGTQEDIIRGTQKEIVQKIPLRRFGTAAEVADAAVFLVTNEYANNCVLNLDGGLSAV